MYQTQPDSPLPRSGTIWVDVTLTYQTFAGPPSGVQRTLLSLARLGDRNAGLNLRLAAYDPKTKIWRALDTPAFLRVFQQKMPKTRPIHQHKLIELIWWRLLLLMARYRRHNPYHLLDPTHQRSRQRRLADSPRLECQPGDVLLLADSGWVMPRHLDAVRAFDSQARIAGLVYDLIPLERPDIVPQPVAEQCLHWFRGLAQTAHQLFCISEFTRRQTKTWLSGDPEIADAIRKLRVVRLGNELADVDQPPLNTLTTLAELARGHAGGQSLPTQAGSATRWYLWLGSLDLRKNLDVVLLALERFYEQHPAADPFVIAGGQGFGYELYERKITGNPFSGRRLPWSSVLMTPRSWPFTEALNSSSSHRGMRGTAYPWPRPCSAAFPCWRRAQRPFRKWAVRALNTLNPGTLRNCCAYWSTPKPTPTFCSCCAGVQANFSQHPGKT